MLPRAPIFNDGSKVHEYRTGYGVWNNEECEFKVTIDLRDIGEINSTIRFCRSEVTIGVVEESFATESKVAILPVSPAKED